MSEEHRVSDAEREAAVVLLRDAGVRACSPHAPRPGRRGLVPVMRGARWRVAARTITLSLFAP